MLPEGAAGQWCELRASLGDAAAWWVKLEIIDAARGHVVREAFLGPRFRAHGVVWRRTLVHVPGDADEISLRVLGLGPAAACTPAVTLRILSRWQAARALLAFGWRRLPSVARGGRLGAAGRARAVLGQAPARAGEAPPYAVWKTLYDVWGPAECHALREGVGAALHIEAVVVGCPGVLMQASLASLARQWLPPGLVREVARPALWQQGAAEWVLVMQAGESLAPHGLACFAHAAGQAPAAAGFFADAEEMGGAGNPLLKPKTADPWLLQSGLPTKGACLFRAGALVEAARAADADAWRKDSALRLPQEFFCSIPFVLTAVPKGLQAASQQANEPPGGALPFISLIVPSAARSAHMLGCLRRLVAQTAYAGGYEIILAVSHVDPNDEIQAECIRAAAALQPVRVLDLKLPAFNYAAANNLAVQQAKAEMIVLLNDDVVPIDPAWLRRMVALFGNPGSHADIVGARLLYGNGMVQHGGVIMGLANLCEHAFRLTWRRDTGPHGLAACTRQVSAVTGACMMLHRSLYRSLAGMDESFAIALNDVDFCLRAGAQGQRIVFAAGVELFHYESLSLGRHYQGERAGLEAVEVRRLRALWGNAIADDPFYSPSASLEPGREFQPGFPPRRTPLSWIAGSPLAQH